jgi:hypothetical protein
MFAGAGGTSFSTSHCFRTNNGEVRMKKVLIATAMTLMCSAAFAQTGTGPAAQSNMDKPGMTKGSMDKGSMDKGSMDKGTTGMNGRDNANGSAGSAPMAHGGPTGGDASQKETPKR